LKQSKLKNRGAKIQLEEEFALIIAKIMVPWNRDHFGKTICCYMRIIHDTPEPASIQITYMSVNIIEEFIPRSSITFLLGKVLRLNSIIFLIRFVVGF
jgi:hypothetical protein